MKSKVYVLLDLVNGSPELVASKLYGMMGIKNVEVLEGSPAILVTIEAKSRKKLAEHTVSSLETIGDMVGTIKLLPVQEATRKAFTGNCSKGSDSGLRVLSA